MGRRAPSGMSGCVGALGLGCWCGESGMEALNVASEVSSCGSDVEFTRGRQRKWVSWGFFSLVVVFPGMVV